MKRIKGKRSPRPPRTRPPVSVREDVDEKLFVSFLRAVLDSSYIQAKLDDGEIDAATAAKLREQVEIDAKTAPRIGEPWFDTRLAEMELSWKVMGYAPTSDVWWYLLCRIGLDLPIEALRTILDALEAQMLEPLPKPAKIKHRWELVCYCRDYAHLRDGQPPMKRLTLTEAFEAAGKMCGMGPDTMKKSYEAYERGQPPELRRRDQRRNPG
jgi:hypothetical protein